MEKLKEIFNTKHLQRLATEIKKVYLVFDEQDFLKIKNTLNKLEMKERVHLIRDQLHRCLPKDFKTSSRIIVASLKDGNLKQFDLWPYTEYIQKYGIDSPEIALPALMRMTELFTAEWAIRPFIKKYPEITWNFIHQCAQSENVHHRRLASEGTRPFVPWGMKLNEVAENPNLSFKFLEKLKDDDELYVRKSVANHLNDLTKVHPELVCKTLKKWKKNTKDADQKKIDWIIRHSLRNLIKSGNDLALELIGINKTTNIKLSELVLSKKKIKIGEELEFQFFVTSNEKKEALLEIDYTIYFSRLNKQFNKKVFKLKKVLIQPRQTVKISKKHSFRLITTRKYYPGPHHLEIQINGVPRQIVNWTLVEK